MNLDVIPGKFGRKPTHEEVEESARRGWENLTILDKEGIEAIPVYHQGERFYWLDKMIDEQYEYIGISPANDRTTPQKQEWLDEVFHYLCGDRGYPEIMPHGFGVTSVPLLYRYPWASVDSATWLKVGGYGIVIVPKWHRKKDDYDYSKSPRAIRVSDRDKPSKNSEDLDSLSPADRDYVVRYIEHEGFDLDKIQTDYLVRQRANCRFFKRVREKYTTPPFLHQPSTLMAETTRQGSSECKWEGGFKMVFAVTTDRRHSDILSDEGVRDRLLSYFYLKGGEQGRLDVRQYVETGRIRNPHAPE